MSTLDIANWLYAHPWIIVGAASALIGLVAFLLRRRLGIGSRIMFFGRWILSFSKWIKSFGATYLVVVFVWVSGAIFSLSVAYKVLVNPETASEANWYYQFVLSALIVVSLVHQGLVFHSLHDLDHNETLKESLKGWLNTLPEWLIRIACVVLLLCVAGEIPHLYHDIVNKFGGAQTSRLASEKPLTSAQTEFALYSVFLFFGLLLWDVGAKRCSPNPATSGQALEQNYCKSDALAFAAWLLICIAPPLRKFWPALRFLPLLIAFIWFEYTREIWKRLRTEVITPSTKYATGS